MREVSYTDYLFRFLPINLFARYRWFGWLHVQIDSKVGKLANLIVKGVDLKKGNGNNIKVETGKERDIK